MKLLEYLQSEPKSRERSNKNRAIGNIILKTYNLDMDKGMMSDIVGEILTLDREWRKILEENPDLRGNDYKDKEKLVQLKLKELGYATNTIETTRGDEPRPILQNMLFSS